MATGAICEKIELLLEKHKRGKKHKTLYRRPKRAVPLGHSINDRPQPVEDRSEFGHWEIDLVVGGKGQGGCSSFDSHRTQDP